MKKMMIYRFLKKQAKLSKSYTDFFTRLTRSKYRMGDMFMVLLYRGYDGFENFYLMQGGES